MKERKLASYVVAEVTLLGIGWFALTAKVSPHEAIVGLVSVLMATGLTGVAWKFGRFRLITQLSLVRTGWLLPFAAVTGTARIFRAALRGGLPGRRTASLIRAVPFEVGGEDETARTRRILALTLPSLVPNSIILGIIPEQQLLLYHQLEATKPSGIMRRLGAKS